MINPVSWLYRRHEKKKAGAFGENIAEILLRDIELQAETLFAPRRYAVLQALDERLRATDFVDNTNFEHEFRTDMISLVDSWSEQADKQEAELKQAVSLKLGEGLSLLPVDMLNDVIAAVIKKQRQALIDAGLKHAEEIMQLQNSYSKLRKR